MKYLDRIIEGVVSKDRSNIIQHLNEALKIISNAAESIGYNIRKINYVKDPEDPAAIKIKLSRKAAMVVRVYDVDDIKIVLSHRVAEAVRIPNYYAIRPSDLNRKEIAALAEYGNVPAIGAAIAKLQEIWAQLKNYKPAPKHVVLQNPLKKIY